MTWRLQSKVQRSDALDAFDDPGDPGWGQLSENR